MVRLNSCCFCCSTRTGSLILGSCSLIASVLGVICAGAVLAMYDKIAEAIRKNPPPDVHSADIEKYISFVRILFIVSLVILLLGLFVASMLIHGIRKERPGLMLPYIVASAFSLISGIVMNVMVITNGGDKITPIVNMVIGALFGTYYLLVIYSHYRDLRDHEGRTSVPNDNKFI